jgi:hypothetical protein
MRANSLPAIVLAAEHGVAEAQFNLGFIYEHGKGVPLDNVEAVSWYRLAAEQGHEAARRRLDFLLCKGGE